MSKLSKAESRRTQHHLVSLVAIVALLSVVAANIIIVHNDSQILLGQSVPEPSGTATTAASTVSTTAPTTVSAADLTSPTQAVPVVSAADLIYPDIPYFIEVDKTHQIVTVYTTSSSGKYDKVVRRMLCSTAQDPDKFPDGYWKLKEDRCTAKNIWRKMKSHGTELYAQYATQITGDFLFHSVPYKSRKKTDLDTKRYSKLGTADSGGCIRLTVENAKWICENCVAGTTVRLISKKADPELEALAAQLKADTVKPDKTGWDPTDPDPKNPNYHPQYTEDTPATEGYSTDNLGLDQISYSTKIWSPNSK